MPPLHRPTLLALSLAAALGGWVGVAAADFRQTADNATIAYEGPSAKATQQFIYSRGTPVEVVVQIEGWVKVRDMQGSLAWIERKALTERTQVQVKAAIADIQAAPDVSSPIVFRAESGVLLQLVTPQPPNAGAWAQVRHRDGQTGFVRIETLFGL
jgi:SH3-like domain-containing protein